jgi:hypothetical protein
MQFYDYILGKYETQMVIELSHVLALDVFHVYNSTTIISRGRTEHVIWIPSWYYELAYTKPLNSELDLKIIAVSIWSWLKHHTSTYE